MSFLDPIVNGNATALSTTDLPVDVAGSAPPDPGYVLKAIDKTHAEWAPPEDTSGPATALATTGAPVNVAGAAPPETGAVLTAGEDPTTATWRTPNNEELEAHVADIANPHLVTKAQVGLSSVTNDEQLKADWSGYLNKTTPTVADTIIIQDAAAGGAIKRAAYPGGSSWSVASSINPRHWWRSDNTVQTGGLVDTIVDNGRAGTLRNFTATGTNRCATAVDANSKTYLNLVGTNRYQAGTSAEWLFLHNGNPFTVCVVLDKQSLPFNVKECVLATCNWGSGSPGWLLSRGTENNNTAGSPTPINFWDTGIMGPSGNPFCLSHGTNINYFGVYIIVVVFKGYRINQGGSGLGQLNETGNVQFAGEMWENGHCMTVQASQQGSGFPSGNSQGALTLGQYVDTALPLTARLYEVLIHDRALTRWNIELYIQDAATRYGVVL